MRTRYAFTFGQAYNLSDNYVLVEADDMDTARRIFCEERAKISAGLSDPNWRWAFCYGPDEWPLIVERFHLTEVPIDTPIDWRDARNPHT